MSLAELTLAAVLAVVHPAAVDVRAEYERLAEVSVAIAAAAERYPSVGGTPEGTALALVAIAKHESEFRADVQDCRRRGDVGRAVTLWQMQRWARGRLSVEALCADVRLAARQAARTLAAHAARCRRSTWRGVFAGYHRDCDWPSAASGRQCAGWERVSRRVGLLAECSGRAVVRPTSGGRS